MYIGLDRITYLQVWQPVLTWCANVLGLFALLSLLAVDPAVDAGIRTVECAEFLNIAGVQPGGQPGGQTVRLDVE